jgi:hypothetical protein
MLPVPNSSEKRKILARDALAMYRNSLVDENWHVPFLAPLGYEQRMYFISLDMFQWPHKIIVHTPNSVALPTPGCRAGMDVLIHTHNVPKFIWLELVYQKAKTQEIPNVVRQTHDVVRQIHNVEQNIQEVNLDSDDEEEEDDDEIYREEMLAEEDYRCEE